MTIASALSEALEKNLDLIAKRAGISIADANLVTAQLRPNPVFSAAGDQLDLLGTGFDAANNAGPPEYAARVDFLFERGDKRAVRTAVAQEERDIAEAVVDDAIRTLALDVRQAFVDVQLAQEHLALARDNAAAFAEIVTLNQTRVGSGDLAAVELLRSRVAALQSQQAVRAAGLKLRAAQRHLEQVMGRTPGSTAFEIEPLPLPAAIAESPADLHTRALRQRPDLRSAQLTQARSQAEIRRQLALGQIDWTIGAEVRRQNGVAGRGNSLGFFFSAPLPVFDRNQGNIARSREEARQVESRVTQIEHIIAADVDLAAAQYAAAEAGLRSIEADMLPQARDVRSITDYSYRRGEATLIEFLDAQRAFNETMQAWNEARAEYARSVFLLRAAVGGETFP